MCLIVKKKGTRTKIAKEDIVCYKEVYEDLKSYSEYFQYELNVLYNTKLTSISCSPYYGNWRYWGGKVQEHYNISSNNCDEFMAYQQGFHSYKNIERYLDDEDVILVECLIPKGTRYIEDETELICSEAIIIIKKL